MGKVGFEENLREEEGDAVLSSKEMRKNKGKRFLKTKIVTSRRDTHLPMLQHENLIPNFKCLCAAACTNLRRGAEM